MAYDIDRFLEIKKKLENSLDRNEVATLLAQKLTEGCGRDLDKFLETKKKIVESLDQNEIVIMMAQKLAEEAKSSKEIIIDESRAPFIPYTPDPYPWTPPITWETTNCNYSDDEQGTTADLR